MKNVRRVVIVIAALSMVLAFAGCDKQNVTNDNNAKETTANESKDETFDSTETDPTSPTDPTSLVVSGDVTGVGAIEALGKDFAGRIEQKLGIPASDVKKYDYSEVFNPSSKEGMYYVCSNSSVPTFDCVVFDDAADARDYFYDVYSRFNKGFNKDRFEGEFEAVYEENYGYIVMNGINPDTNVFGDINAAGNEFYCGIYYSGNVFIRVIMSPGYNCDDVEAMIKKLGLPLADGSNV